ncbi:MAG TPA: hypothetical protein VLC09_07840, partial [Polyangiaceae bacterium]|nr:hypothetical protein [Polyangiaceae bacterium]
MTTTLREVVFAVRHGQAALVAELAGYLVLLAADAAAVRPILVSADALGLDADGEVTLHGAPASEGDAERALRGVLAGLLGLLRSPAPNLQRVAERPELRGLATLVLELEAALVPVNRKAARRSLSRLYRETARARAMVPD